LLPEREAARDGEDGNERLVRHPGDLSPMDEMPMGDLHAAFSNEQRA
jgi:hypothetical protein